MHGGMDGGGAKLLRWKIVVVIDRLSDIEFE